MTGPIGILGAGGFIGNRLVEMTALGNGPRPRPITRHAQALALARRFDLDCRVADGRDRAALAVALDGCDTVVHAIAGDSETIVNTIEPVYRAAEDAGVRRMIYLSSASVHGQSPAPGTTEVSPLSRRQPVAYNSAKIEAEARLRVLGETGKVDVAVLRPGIVYGPRSYWIGNFADTVLNGTAYLWEGGQGICNGIYIDNLVHAVLCAVQAPTCSGQAYLVGDTESYCWADLLGPVATALGTDLADLAAPVAEGSPSLVARLRRIRGFRRLIYGIPSPVRAALKAGWREGKASPQTAHKDSGIQQPVASLELQLLHTCQWKLPSDKAARELGFSPTISLAEAQRRSVSWLAFAGYPVVTLGASA